MDVSEGSGGHSVWGKRVDSESHGQLRSAGSCYPSANTGLGGKKACPKDKLVRQHLEHLVPAGKMEGFASHLRTS